MSELACIGEVSIYAGGSLAAVMIIHAGQVLSKVPSRLGDQHADDILTS